MSPRRPLLLLLALLPLLLGLGPRVAPARLDSQAWREVQNDARRLFGTPGGREAKLELIARMLEDGERRSWKLLVDSLEKEAELWVALATKAREIELQIDGIESRPMAQRQPQEQAKLGPWKTQFEELERNAREQRAVLDAITKAASGGPEELRKDLFQAAHTKVPWTIRAAAVQIAGVHPEEALSFEYLSRALQGDPDPRVRLAALEGLRSTGIPVDGDTPPSAAEAAARARTTADNLIVGRLADGDWGVQLLAVRLLEERDVRLAVPHLINALGEASPRLAEAIVDVLRKFTGENFDPYADVWAQWWEDHKEEYQSSEAVRAKGNARPPSDAHFYGLPIKSDRVLFIIDTSSSMKLPTKNENPAEKWKPKGPVTGDDAHPPPPPPEEILSGPKIDVAKHELKKALEGLPSTARFNIIAFNTSIQRWKEGMMEATDKNKADAIAWVQKMEPIGITYIDGALRVAFRMAGLAAVDKAYPEVNVDTMILLSDGAPTNDGSPKTELMDPEVILEHVREWNKYQRVVINCIGVDIVESIEFMQKLAEQNGGVYIDR